MIFCWLCPHFPLPASLPHFLVAPLHFDVLQLLLLFVAMRKQRCVNSNGSDSDSVNETATFSLGSWGVKEVGIAHVLEAAESCNRKSVRLSGSYPSADAVQKCIHTWSMLSWTYKSGVFCHFCMFEHANLGYYKSCRCQICHEGTYIDTMYYYISIVNKALFKKTYSQMHQAHAEA